MVGTSGCYDKGSYGNLLSWQVCCNGYYLTSDHIIEDDFVLLTNFNKFSNKQNYEIIVIIFFRFQGATMRRSLHHGKSLDSLILYLSNFAKKNLKLISKIVIYKKLNKIAVIIT
jgi:hypothetical protein